MWDVAVWKDQLGSYGQVVTADSASKDKTDR